MAKKKTVSIHKPYDATKTEFLAPNNTRTSAHTIENERCAKIKVQESKSYLCMPFSGKTILLEKRKQIWQSIGERGVILCAHVCLCIGLSELNIRWRFSGVIHPVFETGSLTGLLSRLGWLARKPQTDQIASTSNPPGWHYRCVPLYPGFLCGF